MRLITKEKLINLVLRDCKEFKKVVNYLYVREFEGVITFRVERTYNLNYSLDRETQLNLISLIISFCYGEITTKEFNKLVRKLIK